MLNNVFLVSMLLSHSDVTHQSQNSNFSTQETGPSEEQVNAESQIDLKRHYQHRRGTDKLFSPFLMGCVLTLLA